MGKAQEIISKHTETENQNSPQGPGGEMGTNWGNSRHTMSLSGWKGPGNPPHEKSKTGGRLLEQHQKKPLKKRIGEKNGRMEQEQRIEKGDRPSEGKRH